MMYNLNLKKNTFKNKIYNIIAITKSITIL